MEETDELFKKFELDDTKLKNEMKNINMKRKKFASQVKTIYVSDTDVRYREFQNKFRDGFRFISFRPRQSRTTLSVWKRFLSQTRPKSKSAKKCLKRWWRQLKKNKLTMTRHLRRSRQRHKNSRTKKRSWKPNSSPFR